MTRFGMISAVVGLLVGGSAAYADHDSPCGASPCAAPKADCSPCAKKVECSPCVKKVKCCERVAVTYPVEKTKYRLVKTTQCVPEVKTKCVKDKCNPCAPARVETYTKYHNKTKYHWECYKVVENKVRYEKRCNEQIHSVAATNSAGTQLASAK